MTANPPWQRHIPVIRNDREFWPSTTGHYSQPIMQFKDCFDQTRLNAWLVMKATRPPRKR